MDDEISRFLMKRGKRFLKSLGKNDNAPPVEDLSRNLLCYRAIPKDVGKNMLYREVLMELADANIKYKRQIWAACKTDILFFCNAFLWVYEPRTPATLPFITWDFQDRTILAMEKALGKIDVGVEKSRDMGATWIFLSVFFHQWLFKPRRAFGLVSRTEDAVDKAEDPDTLMWKIDFHMKNLPHWMLPKYKRQKLSLKNENNNSVITGYAATGDVARGGRKTAFGMDEMASFQIDAGNACWASTQHVTDCRIAVSTPKGMAGIFAETMNGNDSEMVKVSLHWTQHPYKRRGLYCSKVDEASKELIIVDSQYEFPENYNFILDGKLRSPWYDRECRRHKIPAFIAQELDIDYGGSGFPFFSESMVDKHSRDFASQPFTCGELQFDTDKFDGFFTQNPDGRLRLWCHLTNEGRPVSGHNYVIGCDIATGSAGSLATNSVASIAVKETGEKVAEFADNSLLPHEFADYVIALKKWFRGPSGEAFLVPEANGPGLVFLKRVMEIAGTRVYFRENEKTYGKKSTKQPGFWSTRDTKRALLGEYSRAVSEGHFINHSAVALEEMLHYVYLPTGAIEHDKQSATLDPTAAGENHGDRVIADALCWRGIQTSPVRSDVEESVETSPYGSMAWRFAQAKKESRDSRALAEWL